MSKVNSAFRNGKAFIPFITCGDPTLELSEQLVYAMEEAGADLIELGIPFSDPTAEGSVIQAANLRALRRNVTTDDVFATIGRIRSNTQIPLAIMTYANVVFSYGIGRFTDRMQELAIDALILPDVPFEEKEEFAVSCREKGIDFVSLIAPTSENRIAAIAGDAEGFVYCVSSLGVTGTRTSFSSDIKSVVENVKEHTNVPCAIGFGISNPEQAKAMAAFSDGVIVGSAIVKLCGTYGEDCVPYVKEFVKNMKDAIR